MAFGQNFYDDDPYQDFYNLSRTQSAQSPFYGMTAAQYADPFMEERKNQIQRLRTLQSNPGAIETSPFYKFLMDTQMKAVNSSNAARGLTRSGRGAMALQDRAAQVASGAYFPLLQNASMLAMSGSSPAAAGISYERGIRASQDQAQMAAAARAAQRTPPQQSNARPWWQQDNFPRSAPSASLPSGGATPYSGTYTPSVYDTPFVTANTPGYTPSAGAGTGYITGSGGGAAVFGQGGFATNGTPLIQEGDYPSYDYGSGGSTYGDSYGSTYSDFGGGGDYYDYGGDYYGGE